MSSIALSSTASTATLPFAPKIPTLHLDAKIGILYDTSQYFEQHSGADLAPLMHGLVTAMGAYIGPRIFVPEPAPEHQYGKLYSVTVGPSSSGKEQTIKWPLDLLKRLDPDWINARTFWGISSGEGIAEAIQNADESSPGWTGQGLIALSEMGQLFAQLQRVGSTTLPILLKAWDDDGRVQVPTRQNPLQLDQSHVGLIGAMTPSAFREKFNDSIWESGFGNRFLIAINSGTKPPSSYTARPGDETRYNQLITQLQQRLSGVRPGPLDFSKAGQVHWNSVIDALWSAEREGGDRMGRIRAKTLRIALIYAAAEGRTSIEPEHIQAGIAWCDYSADCVAALVGRTTGSDSGDRLTQFFRDNPSARMTRSEIAREIFQGHIKSQDLDTALKLGLQHGGIVKTQEGRSDRKGTIHPVTIFSRGDQA
jgi:hypothetical protein